MPSQAKVQRARNGERESPPFPLAKLRNLSRISLEGEESRREFHFLILLLFLKKPPHPTSVCRPAPPVQLSRNVFVPPSNPSVRLPCVVSGMEGGGGEIRTKRGPGGLLMVYCPFVEEEKTGFCLSV